MKLAGLVIGFVTSIDNYLHQYQSSNINPTRPNQLFDQTVIMAATFMNKDYN
ncbi:hypothetical protein HanIR_Chr02g0069091 [Helianthus annuus]|nr:hypothetical protein HanIR_Chr02g0069091 [Helianthus annuus]